MSDLRADPNCPTYALTFDLDFAEIVALSENHRTGIVVFRLRDTRTDSVIRRLGIVLANSATH